MGLIPESGIFLGIERSIHSSILAWIIPWKEEPGLQPMGSLRVRHMEHTHRQQTLKTQYDQNQTSLLPLQTSSNQSLPISGKCNHKLLTAKGQNFQISLDFFFLSYIQVISSPIDFILKIYLKSHFSDTTQPHHLSRGLLKQLLNIITSPFSQAVRVIL